MNIGDLFVAFRGDSRQLEIDAVKAGDKAGKTIGQRMTHALKTGDWGGFLKGGFGLGAGMAAFGMVSNALSGVTEYMQGAVVAASDLAESQSKVDQVFTESSSTIRAWASGAARDFGLSQQAALEAAGTFGNFIQALGNSEAEASSMSRQLVELAADLASFNNQSIDEVLIALRSGLAGEAEPMRRLGVSISATRVENNLLAKGIVKTKAEITDAMKVTERYAIIMEDTTKAQGDFDRTSDGLANTQRMLDATLVDLSATIGGLILGPTTEFTGLLLDAAEGAKMLTANLPGLERELQEVAKDIEDAAGRDLVNDLANAARLIATGGLVLVTDKTSELADNSTDVGKAFEGLVGAGTDLGNVYDDLAGKGTLLGDVFGGIGDAATGKGEFKAYTGELERASNAMALLPSLVQAVTSSYDPLSSITTTTADRFAQLAQAQKRARERLLAFKDAADEVAETRSLGKINDDLKEQRRNLHQAAEAGNVRKFAAATAAIEQLKQEKLLREQGKKALREYLERTGKEKKAQGEVTTKIEGTTKAAEALDKVDPTVKVTTQTSQADAALERIRSRLSEIIGNSNVNVTVSASQSGGTGRVVRRAAGGPVEAFRPYWVGERGPELIVPPRDGRVIPSHAISSAGGGASNITAEIYGLPLRATTPVEVVQQLRRAVRMGVVGQRGAQA